MTATKGGKYHNLIIVRGAGDLASGTILKLHNMGYQVVALECEKPSAIRRLVAFSEAVYAGSVEIEGVVGRLSAEDQIDAVLQRGEIPVVIDPECELVERLQPEVLVDAILAKRNLGTRRNMAPITIGLGPGFTAGEDVDAVVETMRGAMLGRIYYKGFAIPNTGIPGKIAGYDKERVLHSPAAGIFESELNIGTLVKAGDVIAKVGDMEICTKISGVLRGLLPSGYQVTKGFKVADVDPRLDQLRNISFVSDKARCIAGGVVEAIAVLERKSQNAIIDLTEECKNVSNTSLKESFEHYLLDELDIDSEKHRLIAVVGAGGKTTTIYRLARELREKSYQVAITTTTHIQSEPRYGFKPIGHDQGDGKLCGLSEVELNQLRQDYDVVLVEADGSRHHPMKVPAEYEPVIPENADLVIGVAGTDALGQKMEDACHRWEIARDEFGFDPKESVTMEHLQQILYSSKGQMKNVKCEYRGYINSGKYL